MTHSLNKLTGETQSRLLDLLRRAPRTITELSLELKVTDNAVRTHIAALERDGLVEQAGTERSTGGKPARRYGLTTAGEELFPKAYALALQGLVEEIARTEGWAKAVTLLKGVGARVAATTHPNGDRAHRVSAAASALRDLGAEIDVAPTPKGWVLQGHACPLSAVTAGRPEVCSLVTSLVAEITGSPVTERCAHGPHPKCCFEVEA